MHPTLHEIKEALQSDAITHVLLDMDGTLLDKYFDDYFWEHLAPEKYADKHAITFGKAKEELMAKYKSHEETLNWTDIEFWSKELGLDIMALKEQIRHLIEVHPHVEDFLELMARGPEDVALNREQRNERRRQPVIEPQQIGVEHRPHAADGR